jgi:hypothetical protein
MLVANASIREIIIIYMLVKSLSKWPIERKTINEVFTKDDEIEYEKLSIMYNSPLFNYSNLKLSHQLHCVKLNNISNIKRHLTFDDNICEKKRNIFNVFVN